MYTIDWMVWLCRVYCPADDVIMCVCFVCQMVHNIAHWSRISMEAEGDDGKATPLVGRRARICVFVSRVICVCLTVDVEWLCVCWTPVPLVGLISFRMCVFE